MFGDYCDAFNLRNEESYAIIGNEQYNRLLDHIEGDSSKISRIDLEARKLMYARGIKQPRKLTKSEQNTCGADIPTEMEGWNKIKDIIKRYDKEIKTEIECREIKLDEAHGELNMKEKKDLLQVDEMKNIAA